jgi:hypothetical protein
MSAGLGILYLCAVSGVLIILGSFVLLWTRRIYLDKETKQPVDIELPLGIKIKTNTPVIVLIVIGGALLIYSVDQVRQFNEEVTVNGNLTGSSSRIEVYASVASAALPSGGAFSIPLPATHPARKYMLLYTVNGGLLAHQYFDPTTDGKKGLPALEITPPAGPRFVGEIQPQPNGY